MNETYFTLTLLRFLLSFFVDISQRDKKSKRTPEKFNPLFFLKDNKWRLLFSGCMSAIIIAIYHIAPSMDMGDKEDYFAVAVGFCPDFIVAILKRKFGFLKQ